MEDSPDEDPFDWTVDKVCRELCYDEAPWTHDPATLEAIIRENLLDGETLLTYELVYSRDKLMKCLGIKAARHRMKLGMRIINLQSNSRAFLSQKLAVSAKQDISYPEKKSLPKKEEPQLDESQHRNETTVPPSAFEAAAAEHRNPAPQTQPEPDGNRPSKRRRIDPSFLNNVPLNSTEALKQASQADKFKVAIQPQRAADSSLRKTQGDSLIAYLGLKPITAENIIGEQHSPGEDSDDDFQMVSWHNPFIAPAKRQVVHDILRRELQRNFKRATTQQRGEKADGASLAYENEIDDDIIYCSNASDGPDEQTLREMAEEEAENAELAARMANRPKVSEERVKIIIEEAMRKMSQNWETNKKPKHERKAYKLWTHAQKWGQRRQRTFEAERQKHSYGLRIKKIVDEFVSMEWQHESELIAQTKSLEQNVEDRLHHSWLISLYMSRSQPEKPEAIARTKMPAKELNMRLDEELLVSTDEDDFIVPRETLREEAKRFSKPKRTGEAKLEDVSDTVMPDAHGPEPVRGEAVDVIDLTFASDYEPGPTRESLSTAPGEPFTDNLSNDELASIGKTPHKEWSLKKDRWRLAISLLWKLEFSRRKAVLDLLQLPDTDTIWNASIEQLLTRTSSDKQQLDGAALSVAVDLTVVFLSFIKCKYQRERRVMPLNSRDRDRLTGSGRRSFPGFCSFVSSISSCFPDESQIYRPDMLDVDISNLGDIDEGDNDLRPEKGTKTRRAVKEIVRDKGALDLRERERRRLEEQERRRNNLRSAIASNATMSTDKSRLIINESKDDEQGLIYINDDIGARIKEHQIEGVRFLWNQLVVDSAIRQGCLLAHTMGLGKTMQTITFLVAVLEAARSPDESVRSQVPEDLRECRTLILCPSGLVENWMDELLIWAPPGIFGSIRKVEATQSVQERSSHIEDWGETGGILVMGYGVFKSSHKHGQAREDAVDNILTDRANIVIADEAHVLKNPMAKASQLSSQFQTQTRIALTGSPLANNVEEYYYMINWVAPNFLGPLAEFREIYASPIQQGFWNDSSSYQKRKALKLLLALKDTVAPKTNRATIKSCLKDDLPPKYEFVISIQPTALQRHLYHLFIHAVQTDNSRTKSIEQGRVFSILNNLALICAHPACFRQKTEEMQNLVQAGKSTGAFPISIIQNALEATGKPAAHDTKFSHKVELLTRILDESRTAKDKVLVFSQSIPTIDYLMALYSKQGRRICRLDGSTAISKRQDMIKSFNSGHEEVYLISTTAGGVGLNIHGANRVVIFDFKWNPVNDQQAIGRAYRIGQKKTVFVYRFVIAGTFEDDLHHKAVFKTQLASRVVDKKNPISWSKQMQGLLHPIKDVPAAPLASFKGKDHILDQLITCGVNAGILSIVSTDTFEEEDETASLTAEEQKEAENLVERNRLRVSDPQEYQRILEREKAEALNRQSQYIAIPLPASAPLPTTPQTNGWHRASPHPPHVAPHLVNEPNSLPRATNGYSTPPNLPSNGTISGSLPTPTILPSNGGVSLFPSKPPVPTPPPAPYLAVPAPMKGTNTYFASEKARGEELPPAFARHLTPVADTPEAGGSQLPKLSFSPLRNQASGKSKFQTKLLECLKFQQSDLPKAVRDKQPDACAQELADQIDGVLQERGSGFLPDNARWNLLCELLGDDRFALATAAGHFTVTFLVKSDESTIRDQTKALNKIVEDVFKNRMRNKGAEQDPEVEAAHQQQSQSPTSPASASIA